MNKLSLQTFTDFFFYVKGYMNGEDETNAPIQEESNEPGLDKPSSQEPVATVAPVKKKRNSTPAQLETLRLAREKAAEIRALKRKEGSRKQDIDKKKRDEKNAEYQKRWDALKEKEKQEEALKEQKEQKQPVEEESSEEEKVVYKKKKKPSKKKRIVYVESDSSSDEEERVYIKRRSKKTPKVSEPKPKEEQVSVDQNLEDKILQRQYQSKLDEIKHQQMLNWIKPETNYRSQSRSFY